MRLRVFVPLALFLSSSCVNKKIEREDALPPTGSGEVGAATPADFGDFKLTAAKQFYDTDAVLTFCGDIKNTTTQDQLSQLRKTGEAVMSLSARPDFYICRGKYSDKRHGAGKDATSLHYSSFQTRGEIYLKIVSLKDEHETEQPYLLRVESTKDELRMGYENLNGKEYEWVTVDKTNPNEWRLFTENPKVNELMRLQSSNDLSTVLWRGSDRVKLGHLTDPDFLKPFLTSEGEKIVEREFTFKADVPEGDLTAPCPADLVQIARTQQVSICRYRNGQRSLISLITKKEYDSLYVAKLLVEKSATSITGDEVFVMFGKKGDEVIVRCGDSESGICRNLFSESEEKTFGIPSKDDLTSGVYYNVLIGDIPVGEFKLRKIL